MLLYYFSSLRRKLLCRLKNTLLYDVNKDSEKAVNYMPLEVQPHLLN
jgi:hypothetical protein